MTNVVSLADPAAELEALAAEIRAGLTVRTVFCVLDKPDIGLEFRCLGMRPVAVYTLGMLTWAQHETITRYGVDP